MLPASLWAADVTRIPVTLGGACASVPPPAKSFPGSEVDELAHADGVWAGLTRFTAVDGPSQWTPSQRETIYVLQGEVRIEIAGGPTWRSQRPTAAANRDRGAGLGGRDVGKVHCARRLPILHQREIGRLIIRVDTEPLGARRMKGPGH
jgi:hypothetical protein